MKITDINLFKVSGDSFSADVQIAADNGAEFSVQLGTDGGWSFQPEFDINAPLVAEALSGFVAENSRKPTDNIAASIAAKIGAVDAVDAAKRNPKNWM